VVVFLDADARGAPAVTGLVRECQHSSSVASHLVRKHSRRRATQDEGLVMKRMFGPREFQDGRVRVYGCSPGWILLWILISIVLTVIVNVLLNLIF
jgi:hypothetical protein